MDRQKISRLHVDLNSEPESSYNSDENQQINSDMSLSVDLNSIPESSCLSCQNQQTHSFFSFDLNSVTESSCLFVDLNLEPESPYDSSENQQANSCFKSGADNQQDIFLSKRKRLERDAVGKDEIIAKRVKADREKLRRDRLNDSFEGLGNILDPNRHKNNKRTILVDAIDVLKDLTSELSRLKVENAALSEESRELIQEKSELRLEKASLKSDIENLEIQFQRSLNLMLQCAPTDPSEFVAQPISYSVSLRAPSCLIPIHSPPLQSIPFLKNQSGMSSNSGSTFSPYLTLVTPCIDKPSTSIASTSYNPCQQNFESKPSGNGGDKVDGFGGFATELELMPGSISKKLSPRDKGKRPLEDDESIRDGSSFERALFLSKSPGQLFQ